MSPGLSVGGVGGVSSDLSVGYVGKAAGGNAVLAPSLAIGVGCSVWGVATTGRSLAIPPELSVGGVGEVTVGAGIALELAVGVVEGCVLRDDATSVRQLSRLSFGVVDGRATGLFSPVL